MSDIQVSGEVSNSKLAAVFANQAQARDAIAAMLRERDLQSSQVKLVTSESSDVDIQLEPEGGGIKRTIIAAHVWLGIAGAVAGLILFAILLWMDVPFVERSPWPAGSVAVAFGSVAGLMLGGLVSLRPDHDGYIHATRDAMSDGRATVVVHALSSEQRSRAAEFLNGRGAQVTETL